MRKHFIKATQDLKTLFFKSDKEAADYFNVPVSRITEAINANIYSSNNEINEILKQKKTINGFTISRTGGVKPVLQYSLNGELLAEYDSIVDAEATIKHYGLSRPINSRNRVWKGSYWVFKDCNFITEQRYIICLDTHGSIIGTYNSIKEASDDTCIEPLIIFTSMLNYNRVEGFYFIDSENIKMQILEMNAYDATIANIYPKLNMACVAAKIKATELYYSCKAEKAINGKIYYKLSEYIANNG